MSRTQRSRTAVGVAVALAALLTAACTGSTPPDLSPVTVPGPSDRVTLFGTSVPNSGADFAGTLAARDAELGPLQVVRIYNPGPLPPWPGSQPDLAARPAVVSFKAQPSAILSGSLDDSLETWFRSVPAGRPLWWSYFHEPEDDIAEGRFTAQEFRDAFAHVSAIAAKVGNPALKSTLILQCRTLRPEAGRTLADYDPGPSSYDVLSFDCYNREAKDGRYPDPADWLGPLVSAAKDRDRPLGLPEIGSQLIDGDDGAQRAHWLREVAAYAAAQGVVFVTYFDSDITGLDYRLDDAPSRDAWREVTTGEAPAG